MNPISGILIGTLLSVSMAPSKSDMGNATAVSAQLAVSQTRASFALPAADDDKSTQDLTARKHIAIYLAVFALDAKRDSDSTLKAGQSKKPATKKTPPLPKRQILVFKATWCGACQLLNPAWPKLRRVRWRVGTSKTDHFRLVDSDEHPDMVSRYGITALPTIVLLENGREIDRTGQILNAVDLAEFYYGRLR